MATAFAISMKAGETSPRGSVALGGFLSRRERWGLTMRGWLLLLSLLLAGSSLVIWKSGVFLTVNQPVEAETLIVEGWIPAYAIEEIAKMAAAKPSCTILTVGGPVSGAPNPAPDDDTYAYVAAMKFKEYGLGAGKVTMVPTKAREQDRTAGAAAAARDWLVKNGRSCETLNVATLGVHARRSRLLYERVFGSATRVGVIAIRDREYDVDSWWRNSEGVKQVASEGLAYLYSRVRL